MFKKALVISAVALLVFGLAACGGGDGNDDVPAGPPEIKVGLAEWQVTVDVASVASGDVTFNASNDGGLPHELVVLKTDLEASNLPVESATVDEAAAGEVVGEIQPDQLPAGASASATFNLTPGSYVLFCNIPAHYEQGMRTSLTVQ